MSELISLYANAKRRIAELERENAALWKKLEEIVTESDDSVRFQIARNALADKGKQP